MNELPTSYDAQEIEGRISALWERSGYFNPDKRPAFARASAGRHGASDMGHGQQRIFSMVLPPPNATGILHMGHALMLTIQDVMARYHRMKGEKTLWLPGTDHAAIATQEKVERELYKKEGKRRQDLGREEFLRRVDEFVEANRTTIRTQLKKMGASLDWSREAFTLDEPRTKAVYEAFKRMYDAGLIYRGERIVNWDPKLQTTVSDDEVEWREEKAPFYYLKYGPFVIATARLETKFGDKYVVMHPSDKRYAKWKHGDTLEVEWINGKVTATVIKDKAVDPKFGTGVMTITPWHDAADFDIAERHKLEKQQIIDFYGRLLPVAGEFAGKKIVEARPLIVEKLKGKGLLEKVDENYTHRIATSQRGGGLIEPQIMKQWFVSVSDKFKATSDKIKGIKKGQDTTLKELMLKAVQSGQIKIIPERFKKTYSHWIKNLRDWCISRQIWYGHRIPVWYPRATSDMGQETRRWNLKIYGEDIFDAIANGTKKIETRAGRPRGEEKYWGDFKEGDAIEFRLADEKNDKIIPEIQPIKKRVKTVRHFSSIEEMLKSYKPSDDYPGKTKTQIVQWWKDRPKLWGRIQKHGIWAIELKDEEEIHVGPQPPENGDWKQDPDTLDTWFSSGLWTFSTLGWPQPSDRRQATSDLATFHPMTVLETGYDILFFWVARMVLMTGFLLGDVPFKTVYLNGLVRGEDRQKMSKSKGNAIDPLGVADIYGTDAVRMALIVGNAPGNDPIISEDKIRGYRNFATKIWNIARFLLLQEARGFTQKILLTAGDKKNLKDFAAFKTQVTKDMDEFRFHEASAKIYHYLWHTFADKIIEEAKPRLSGTDEKGKYAAYAMLTEIFTGCLKLLHPFMPFVTEELYQQIGTDKKLLIIEKW